MLTQIDSNHSAFCNYLQEEHKENAGSIDKLRSILHELEVFSLDPLLDHIKIALNPAYYPMTNKKIYDHVLETKGQSLYKGLKNFQRDLKEGNLPKLSCTKSFSVGDNIANTKGDVVFENHLMELIHYKSKTVHEEPLLIIPPWINKFYIFDLGKEKSFVQFCIDHDIDTYIISWKNPKKEDKHIRFKDYIKDGIEKCLKVIQKPSHVLGFCLGGVGTLIASLRENSIRSTTLLATPIDFSKLKEIKKTIDYMNVQKEFKRVHKNGYQSGKDILKMFCMLRPEQTLMNHFVNQYYLDKSPEANDFLFWNMDAMNLPAKMHNEYLRDFFINNKLYNDKYYFEKKKLSLNKLKKPLFIVAAKKDHIVPKESSFVLPNATYVLVESGHIAGIINPPHNNKYGYQVLGEDAKPGSWWFEWVNWLKPQLGSLKTQKRHFSIRKAPGKYVFDQEHLKSYL